VQLLELIQHVEHDQVAGKADHQNVRVGHLPVLRSDLAPDHNRTLEAHANAQLFDQLLVEHEVAELDLQEVDRVAQQAPVGLTRVEQTAVEFDLNEDGGAHVHDLNQLENEVEHGQHVQVVSAHRRVGVCRSSVRTLRRRREAADGCDHGHDVNHGVHELVDTVELDEAQQVHVLDLVDEVLVQVEFEYLFPFPILLERVQQLPDVDGPVGALEGHQNFVVLVAECLPGLLLRNHGFVVEVVAVEDVLALLLEDRLADFDGG